MIKDGPMKQHIDGNTEGVIKQEFTTYRKRDGMLIKETTIRQYMSNGDYHDSFYHEPLVKISE